MNKRMGKAKTKALAIARESKRNLLRAAGLNEAELLKLYDNSLDGYNDDMVEEMREQYGENKMTKIKGDGILKRLFGCIYKSVYDSAACAGGHIIYYRLSAGG